MSIRLKTFRSDQDDLGGSKARNNNDSRDISNLDRFSGEECMLPSKLADPTNPASPHQSHPPIHLRAYNSAHLRPAIWPSHTHPPIVVVDRSLVRTLRENKDYD
jgi:hypothetical protein